MGLKVAASSDLDEAIRYLKEGGSFDAVAFQEAGDDAVYLICRSPEVASDCFVHLARRGLNVRLELEECRVEILPPTPSEVAKYFLE